jgi:hypothetical protein
MNKKNKISEVALDLYNYMPDLCWMTAANLAKAIRVRKAEIRALLDELEEARLVDIFLFKNGKRSNPRRLIKKVKKRKPKTYPNLLNAIYIGFPIYGFDRNSTIEVYLKSNLPVFPFEPLGKRPVIDVYSWSKLNIETKLDFFFNNPSLNIGLRIPRDICVIDLDTKTEGWTNLSGFQETLTVSTARGFHYYFQSDSVVNVTTAGILPNIDTRCKGSFVVIPPSKHRSGGSYEWFNINKPQSLPIQFRRAWREAHFKTNKSSGGFHFNEGIIHEGSRNQTLWRYGRSLRARGFCFSEIEEALILANREYCLPSLPAMELNKLIKHIWEFGNLN